MSLFLIASAIANIPPKQFWNESNLGRGEPTCSLIASINSVLFLSLRFSRFLLPQPEWTVVYYWMKKAILQCLQCVYSNCRMQLQQHQNCIFVRYVAPLPLTTTAVVATVASPTEIQFASRRKFSPLMHMWRSYFSVEQRLIFPRKNKIVFIFWKLHNLTHLSIMV